MSVLALHTRRDPAREDPSPKAGEREDAQPRAMLRCAACGTDITDPVCAFSIAGAHRHTFVNPQGEVFEIGCFREAPGCASVGASTDFFSWFPGYAWRVALCRGCTAQLGWSYGSPSRASEGTVDFWGLILARLIEAPESLEP